MGEGLMQVCVKMTDGVEERSCRRQGDYQPSGQGKTITRSRVSIASPDAA